MASKVVQRKARGEKSNDKQQKKTKISMKHPQQGKKEQSNNHNTKKRFVFDRYLLFFVVHIACVLLYLIPILKENKFAGATLDEMHIMSQDNKDIHSGNVTIDEIFTNDYWGRPMNSESSHKSWRPLTVLSFRYLKGWNPYDNLSQITFHRIINILTHATIADIVGILSTQLFPFFPYKTLLHIVTKIIFILHPTHVEVTANAANRPHLFALLCSTILCDLNLSLQWFIIALILGFLCSETFIFSLPAVIVTMIIIQYMQQLYRNYNNNKAKSKTDNHDDSDTIPFMELIYCAISLLPRLFMIIMTTVLYLGFRHFMDWLDIPSGLIRPAENPFYDFEGMHRIRNYSYIFAIHVMKSLGIDPIGFSHEYGFECIPAINDWHDKRLYIPLVLFITLVVIVITSIGLLFTKPNNKNNNSSYPVRKMMLGYFLVHLAWLISLFPISGLVKVGTFIADRIVVASTVSVCIWIGYALSSWIVITFHNTNNSRQQHHVSATITSTTTTPLTSRGKPLQIIIVLWLFFISYRKVHNRVLDWMDPVALLKSSLVTCPRFAKAHSELSKVYSGLYSDLFDLQLSRKHLELAYEIDKDYCDVHQQFAHVAIQQGNYIEYEEQLTEAVLCPYTMGGAIEMWRRYWNMVLNSGTTNPKELQKAKQRQAKFSDKINAAVETERQKMEKQQKLL